jgi:hypothetical protein
MVKAAREAEVRRMRESAVTLAEEEERMRRLHTATLAKEGSDRLGQYKRLADLSKLDEKKVCRRVIRNVNWVKKDQPRRDDQNASQQGQLVKQSQVGGSALQVVTSTGVIDGLDLLDLDESTSTMAEEEEDDDVNRIGYIKRTLGKKNLLEPLNVNKRKLNYIAAKYMERANVDISKQLPKYCDGRLLQKNASYFKNVSQSLHLIDSDLTTYRESLYDEEDEELVPPWGELEDGEEYSESEGGEYEEEEAGLHADAKV